MAHSHNHTGHSHHGSRSANQKALFISFGLIFTFMMIEVIGGILTNSLALLSDAGHMLSDAAALGFSLLAFKLGEKAASASKTFGYRRFEILAAFINGITLLLISLYIFGKHIIAFSPRRKLPGVACSRLQQLVCSSTLLQPGY